LAVSTDRDHDIRHRKPPVLLNRVHASSLGRSNRRRSEELCRVRGCGVDVVDPGRGEDAFVVVRVLNSVVEGKHITACSKSCNEVRFWLHSQWPSWFSYRISGHCQTKQRRKFSVQVHCLKSRLPGSRNYATAISLVLWIFANHMKLPMRQIASTNSRMSTYRSIVDKCRWQQRSTTCIGCY